jgi:DNA-binding response OmpR family regulator
VLAEALMNPFRGRHKASIASVPSMSLRSLLWSSDDKTVRVLSRVLNDLEIGVEHFSASDEVIRQITRQRFEAIIVDCFDPQDAGNVLRAAKAAPVNKRALSIVLVEPQVGLKGGFDMGAHFVLHKPLAVERAKSSFRAVRALMKRERRSQLRVPVQIPVECVGSGRYPAKTLDLCEGGMAIHFSARKSRESVLRFSFKLPGIDFKFDVWGEMAWEGDGDQAGVRFKDLTADQRNALRNWLKNQLPEPEPEDMAVACRLAELSLAGCYLTTNSPFPKSTRVTLSLSGAEAKVGGVVRIVHPEFGMGIEFVQSTVEQRNLVRRMIDALQAGGDSPELQVEPEGLESAADATPPSPLAAGDALITLFNQKAQLPVEAFMQQMHQRRQVQAAR